MLIVMGAQIYQDPAIEQGHLQVKKKEMAKEWHAWS